MKFSKEPVVWVSAIVAILIVVRDYLTDGISMDSLNAAWVAIGGVIMRSQVTPVAKDK